MTAMKTAAVLLSLSSLGAGQQVGSYVAEDHPSLTIASCTVADGCWAEKKSVVMDANWRWVHTTTEGSYDDCFDNGHWDDALCPDPVTCAANCALEGISSDMYVETYGVTAVDDALTLELVVPGGNVGSRVYLLEVSRGGRCRCPLPSGLLLSTALHTRCVCAAWVAALRRRTTRRTSSSS